MHYCRRMTPRGYRQFSHLPLAGTALACNFTSIIGVREEVAEPFDRKPKRLRYLVLLYTEAGEALNRVGDQHTPYSPGSLIVEPYGQRYADRTIRLPWRMRYLLLVGPMADEFQAQYWPGGDLQSRRYESPPAAWLKRLVELVELTFDQPPGWPWRLLAQLGALFDALLSSPLPTQPYRSLLDQVQQLIEANPDNPWRLPALASALRVEAKTLARRFQQTANQPPAAWVRQQRMRLALKFLHQGMSVIETANQLGFSDPSCFSRQFKTVVRVSPSGVQRPAPEHR